MHTRKWKLGNSELTISVMSGKLEGLAAINTSPLDNPYCMGNNHEVCKICYSKRMLNGCRKMCRPSWKINGELLSSQAYGIDTFRNMFKAGSIVRFNGHGELINDIHYWNLVKIAVMNPETTFALWTKRYDIVQNHAHPPRKNMFLIYSEPSLNIANPEIPSSFDKVFAVYTDDRVEINCGGKQCKDCMLCYSHNDVTIIREKAKTDRKQGDSE